MTDDTQSAIHKPEPVELGEMAPRTANDSEGDWEEVHAVGRAKGKDKAKGNASPRPPQRDIAKLWESRAARGQQSWTSGHDDIAYFPYNCHSCGEKGHAIVQRQM